MSVPESAAGNSTAYILQACQTVLGRLRRRWREHHKIDGDLSRSDQGHSEVIVDHLTRCASLMRFSKGSKDKGCIVQTTIRVAYVLLQCHAIHHLPLILDFLPIIDLSSKSSHVFALSFPSLIHMSITTGSKLSINGSSQGSPVLFLPESEGAASTDSKVRTTCNTTHCKRKMNLPKGWDCKTINVCHRTFHPPQPTLASTHASCFKQEPELISLIAQRGETLHGALLCKKPRCMNPCTVEDTQDHCPKYRFNCEQSSSKMPGVCFQG